jgi:2-keto-4-pentenoate hydratase/2-oxohepta-3-ene-1,7-dioic acid hydratase in catechol pathway
MRVASYRDAASEPWRTGVVVDDVVVETDLSVRDILSASPADREALTEAGPARPLDELELGPPVPDPQKIICLGLNYHEHARETALPTGSVPTLFAKFPNALTGSGSPIVLPAASREVDFEGELALVIGRRGKDIPEERVFEHVGGYMPLNDVSARDLQLLTSQWMAGKMPDTFAPCGPALVLADEVPDPEALQLETRVNGATLQSASTGDMIFGIRQTVRYVSQLVTLEVGDIISMGTPAGVGFKREPPVFLQPGDMVEVEIEGLGVLRNPVAGGTDAHV